MTHRFLFEEEELEKPRRKKKSDEKEIRKMVDVKVGEFSASIPESALKTVIAFIRELLMADMNTDDVIELIITQVKANGKPDEDVEKIRKILLAIKEKFDPEFINKIPTTFPFLAAVGKDSYLLKDLNPESLALLNYSKKQIGRGEVAIPLLFGIHTFVDPEDKSKKGTNAYDLIYNGNYADIKDFRTETNGKLVLTNEIRLGEPASKDFIDAANAVLAKNSNAVVNKLQAEDFVSQSAGAKKIVDALKQTLEKLSINKLKLMTHNDVKKELDDAITEITGILDTAASSTITTKYPGGFFTIDKDAIKIIQGSGFGFKRLPGGSRLVVAPTGLSLFKNGLKNEIDLRLDEVYTFIEEKTDAQMDTGEIEDIMSTEVPEESPDAGQEPEDMSEPVEDEQPITEMILRRLIRAL